MPRKKNRQKPVSSMSAVMPENQKERHWLKWFRRLFLASGWLAAAFVGVFDLPAKINSFAENYPPAKEATLNAAIDYKKYAGRFSSDPESWVGRNLISDGTEPPDQGDVQLDIKYLGDGKYFGEIHSAYMAEHSFAPWSRFMIDGEVGLTGTFEGIVSGSRAPHALFRLSPEDKSNGSLRLTPIVANGIFPGEVVLWPTNFEMTGGVHGQRFEDLLLEVVAQSAKNEKAQKDRAEAK